MRTRRAVVVAWALLSLPWGRTLVAGEDERVAWLREHALPLATIDPTSPGLGDLEPLRRVLGGVRVVMLGEASRGDGSAFLAKTRLIRFLHQELGFDVLVFEGGFYDCARAWEEIRAGGDTRHALGRALFPFYTDAAQFQPLIELVAKLATSDRPLVVAGIDPQNSGGMDGKGLTSALRGVLERFGVAPDGVDGFPELEAALGDVLGERYLTGEVAVPSRPQRQRILGVVAELRRRLTAWRDPHSSATGPDAAFWLQVLDNLESYCEMTWRQGKLVPGGVFSPELYNLRDRQMADNLVWLARTGYRGRKLIVWSLDVHLARDLDRLTTGEAATSAKLDEMSTIGDEVAKALGNEVYTIAFTAFAGDHGALSRPTYRLLPPTQGSFEDLMARTGLAAAIVDLRQLDAGGSWLKRSLIARPISYKELLGIWPRHVDALLYVRELEAARPRAH